jgi:pseudaminic acid biosynthesis-associated methylase
LTAQGKVKTTAQMKVWQGNFGKEYTDRNTFSVDDLDDLYRKNYGTTRTEVNKKFLAMVQPSDRILEVGCNVGNQLLTLQKMGFSDLYGMELQSYAAALSKQRLPGVQILQGSALDIPFPDDFFELVFTSGLLTHIHPSDLSQVMKEIYRCARRYIWGFEAYGEQPTEIVYREHPNLFWKADYARIYRDRFAHLQLIQEKPLKYLADGNIDSMFLLKKGNRSL